jgi:hypothetical protein
MPVQDMNKQTLRNYLALKAMWDAETTPVRALENRKRIDEYNLLSKVALENCLQN